METETLNTNKREFNVASYRQVQSNVTEMKKLLLLKKICLQSRLSCARINMLVLNDFISINYFERKKHFTKKFSKFLTRSKHPYRLNFFSRAYSYLQHIFGCIAYFDSIRSCFIYHGLWKKGIDMKEFLVDSAK